MWDGFLKKKLKEEMFAAMQEVWHLPCKSCNIVTFQHRIAVMSFTDDAADTAETSD